jgi:Tfp pilus assembly protein PilF
MGRYTDAAKALEKAVGMGRTGHKTAANLADAYRHLGLHDKARAIYDETVKLALKAHHVNPRDATTVRELGL